MCLEATALQSSFAYSQPDMLPDNAVVPNAISALCWITRLRLGSVPTKMNSLHGMRSLAKNAKLECSHVEHLW